MVREGVAPARLAVAAAIRQFLFIIYTSCGAEAEWHARAGLVAAIHTISHSVRTISCLVFFLLFLGMMSKIKQFLPDHVVVFNSRSRVCVCLCNHPRYCCFCIWNLA